MSQKKIIPFINGENELSSSIVTLADRYCCEGADSLYLYNFTGDEASVQQHSRNLLFFMLQRYTKSGIWTGKTALDFPVK